MRLLTSGLLACSLVAGGLTAQPTGEARVGTYEATFDSTHPLADLTEITRRMRWPRGTMKRHEPDPGYAIDKERFFVHVPDDYRDDGTFGLLVWISPGPQGNCARDWPETLARHRLIHVGAHGAGNERLVWYRIALALDAVHNMTRRYRLDADRIYVFGHSGGGRTATTVSMLWPDVFGGGIYANGANHFREIKKPGQKVYWPAKFPKPGSKALRLAQRASRHVFVNGERDFNLVHSRLVEEDLRRRQRFKRTTLLVMDGLGHAPPDAAWLSKCIDALDGPLLEDRAKQDADGKNAKKKDDDR